MWTTNKKLSKNIQRAKEFIILHLPVCTHQMWRRKHLINSVSKLAILSLTSNIFLQTNYPRYANTSANTSKNSERIANLYCKINKDKQLMCTREYYATTSSNKLN